MVYLGGVEMKKGFIIFYLLSLFAICGLFAGCSSDSDYYSDEVEYIGDVFGEDPEDVQNMFEALADEMK